MQDNGLVTIPSRHGAGETLDRLQASLAANGIAVFARIDHAAGAASVGMALPPTEVLIFGHPKGGTPLMQVAPRIGLDLPLKVLAWQDADGRAWLTYTDIAWLARRYDLGEAAAPAVAALAATLAKLAAGATS